VLTGGAGDDVLIGGGGIDVLDGGPGDNTVIPGAIFAAPVAGGSAAMTTDAASAALLGQFMASSFVSPAQGIGVAPYANQPPAEAATLAHPLA